jgi:biotin carboxyl carrier protein
VSNPARVVDLGRGRFRIERPDGTHGLAYAAIDGARTWVFVEGETFVLEPPQTRRGGTSADTASLAAPMPATVTQIHVKAGDRVQPGDALVTLEAMKMELAIRASVDATVKAVNCQPGELVQPGRPLVDLE